MIKCPTILGVTILAAALAACNPTMLPVAEPTPLFTEPWHATVEGAIGSSEVDHLGFAASLPGNFLVAAAAQPWLPGRATSQHAVRFSAGHFWLHDAMTINMLAGYTSGSHRFKRYIFADWPGGNYDTADGSYAFKTYSVTWYLGWPAKQAAAAMEYGTGVRIEFVQKSDVSSAALQDLVDPLGAYGGDLFGFASVVLRPVEFRAEVHCDFNTTLWASVGAALRF